MCMEISNNFDNELKNTFNMNLRPAKKPAYSLKKLFKQLFKARRHQCQQQKQQQFDSLKKIPSMESLESIDNQLNAEIESHCSLESFENDINERRSVSDCDVIEMSTVPVHFVRTEHGTFFWTAAVELPVDNDLIEPLYCNTTNQIAIASYCKGHWAQA